MHAVISVQEHALGPDAVGCTVICRNEVTGTIASMVLPLSSDDFDMAHDIWDNGEGPLTTHLLPGLNSNHITFLAQGMSIEESRQRFLDRCKGLTVDRSQQYDDAAERVGITRLLDCRREPDFDFNVDDETFDDIPTSALDAHEHTGH